MSGSNGQAPSRPAQSQLGPSVVIVIRTWAGAAGSQRAVLGGPVAPPPTPVRPDGLLTGHDVPNPVLESSQALSVLSVPVPCWGMPSVVMVKLTGVKMTA